MKQNFKIRGKLGRWRERISASWQKQLASILQTGQLLNEAKESLEHGQWLRMISRGLPFKERTAQKLMAIARDANLTNTAHGPYLPPCWRTLYELRDIPAEEFEGAIQENLVFPEMERADAEALSRVVKPFKNPITEDEVLEARKTLLHVCRNLSDQRRKTEANIVYEALVKSPRERLAAKLENRQATNGIHLGHCKTVIALRKREAA